MRDDDSISMTVVAVSVSVSVSVPDDWRRMSTDRLSREESGVVQVPKSRKSEGKTVDTRGKAQMEMR